MNPIVLSQNYYPNTGAGGLVYMIATAVSAIISLTLYFTGWVAMPLWVALLPIIQIVLRSWLYTLIHNAMHSALRFADNDCRLDEIVTSGSVEPSILTADAFISKARGE